MSDPGVPGRTTDLALACGETIDVNDIDLGMRSIECACGDYHAVVTDAHPLARFVPEDFVAVLRDVVETDDDFDDFSTPHALAMVREEFPDDIVVEDCSDDGAVGFALVWIADFDSRHLHELVVELLVELMDHAVGHVEDEKAVEAFDEQLDQFDIEEFVDIYRRERDFETEFDVPV